MNITLQDLLLIIGEQTVVGFQLRAEIVGLQAQVAALQAQLEAAKPRLVCGCTPEEAFGVAGV